MISYDIYSYNWVSMVSELVTHAKVKYSSYVLSRYCGLTG